MKHKKSKQAKERANKKAKDKYYLKHSTAVTREIRVYNSVIKRVLLHHNNGLRTFQIAKKIRKNRHLVTLIKNNILFLRKPIKELDLMLPNNMFQEYNKYGIVNCRCGKFYPEESNHYCPPTIKKQ